MNNSFKDRLVLRAKFLELVRGFFSEEGFLEVETPLMNKAVGLEPNLTPFETKLIGRDGKSETRYLITSPEHQMKMLLCAGIGSIFQICKCFRNCEEGSPLHNPEFTMLEWYHVDVNYTEVMKDTENLFRYVTKKLLDSDKFIYQSEEIDVSGEWERISVQEAFSQFADVENLMAISLKNFRAAAEKLEVQITDVDTWDDIFYKIFLSRIEKELGRGRPTILYDYPAHMAALSKKRGDVCERFEIYIAGIELANAFSELTDAKEQRKRFEEENKERIQRGKSELPMPEDFLKALEKGMPECSGIALGLDRMLMLLTDSTEILDNEGV
jgi:lysyl-tRNA synthetase class 2